MTHKELLIDLLSVQTTSGNEFNMIAHIFNFCRQNVPEADVKVKDNNIYITKGESDIYPCVVAHTDTVHDIHDHFKVFDDDGCLFAFNAKTGTQVGVGGDDKVGIWLALEMLMRFDKIKCAFFHSEEIGCVGSRAADMDWFKDVGYCLQGDRRGNKDFVNNISGKLFSKRFSKAIAPILAHHGYSETTGAITDVGQLAENGIGVCVANMSCGYYAPHSDQEIVEFDHADNCRMMMENIITELGCNKFEYSFSCSYGNYNNKWGDWSGADEDFWYGNDVEVVDDNEGNESCYYCGCKNLQESSFKGYKFCPDCDSDILSADDYEEKAWNNSFDDYEDISDNYDGSMKHKAIVNQYLTNYNKNK
tara:strand:+ start:12757 stop:13842 length:1086 start_codon:yes stop_codon:yes gene_type:complete